MEYNTIQYNTRHRLNLILEAATVVPFREAAYFVPSHMVGALDFPVHAHLCMDLMRPSGKRAGTACPPRSNKLGKSNVLIQSSKCQYRHTLLLIGT
jgi:hypothetical protein